MMKKTFKKRGQRIVKKVSEAPENIRTSSEIHLRKNLIDKLGEVSKIRILVLEWGLLVSVLFLLALAQSFWFGESYAENGFASGGTYTEATIGEVNSLNPLFATTNSEKVLSRLLFATISEVDYSGNLGIGLASSITSSDNGKVWTIKLRDNLKWSDGEPITNADVLFTVNTIKNPVVASIYDSFFTNVQVVENEDGTITFILASAYADFISALNVPVLPVHILGDVDPKTLIENNFSVTPVTSGAFTFNAVQSSQNGKEKIIYLSANSNYYKGNPMLDSFAVHTFTTRDDIVAAVNSGSITATAELDQNDSKLVAASNFTKRTSDLNSGAFMFFNMSRSIMGSVEVRSAIREGLNMENVRSVIGENIPLDYPIPKTQIDLAEYPAIPAQNTEAAKQRLLELFGGEIPTINLATINYGTLPIVAEQIADELRGLGFGVEVAKYEENQEFVNSVIAKRNYDILVYEVELGADSDVLPYYHSSQATSSGLNLSNYRNTMVDDLLLGARDTTDKTLRNKKYSSFLQYWVNDVPAIGLYQGSLTYYYNRNVQTYGENLHLATALDRFVDIKSWATVNITKEKTP